MSFIQALIFLRSDNTITHPTSLSDDDVLDNKTFCTLDGALFYVLIFLLNFFFNCKIHYLK